MSWGRVTQTTANEGFNVSCGGPVAMSVAMGYAAGVGGRQPNGAPAQEVKHEQEFRVKQVF